jgi:hypothetical protein
MSDERPPCTGQPSQLLARHTSPHPCPWQQRARYALPLGRPTRPFRASHAQRCSAVARMHTRKGPFHRRSSLHGVCVATRRTHLACESRMAEACTNQMREEP